MCVCVREREREREIERERSGGEQRGSLCEPATIHLLLLSKHMHVKVRGLMRKGGGISEEERRD